MRLAWRIAAGPKRAHGRFEVPRSNGMPATQIAASALARSTPRNVGRVANVGTEVITPIWGGLVPVKGPSDARHFSKYSAENECGRPSGGLTHMEESGCTKYAFS